MELVVEGSLKKGWLLGRRTISLAVSGDLKSSEASAETGTALALYRELYPSFCKMVAAHLSPSLEGTQSFDLLAVLAHLSRTAPAGLGGSILPLRLLNMRGRPPENAPRVEAGAPRGETLLEIHGIVELPSDGATDPGEPADDGSRQEHFFCSVETHFERFVGKDGIEYRLEYRDRFPIELRDEGPPSVFRRESPIHSFRFTMATDLFEPRSSGISYGGLPAVIQQSFWRAGDGGIRLGFSRELERQESTDLLRSRPEIVDFDRALSALGLYTGLTERCVNSLGT